MKKLIILFSIVIHSVANADCSTYIQKKLRLNKKLFVTGEVATIPALVFHLPAGLILSSGIGTAYLIKTRHSRKLLRVIQQSESCSGKQLNRFYKKYASQSPYPITKEKFCVSILEINKNGNLCPFYESILKDKEIFELMN